MSTQTIDAEEIISGYKAAAEHAYGSLFASELKISHADGWFTVHDLDGTETRYRQKELVSLTRQLLKEPAYKPENLSDIFTEVALARKEETERKASIQQEAPRKNSQTFEPAAVTSHLNSYSHSVDGSLARVALDDEHEVAVQGNASTGPAPSQSSSAPTGNVVPFPLAAASTQPSLRALDSTGSTSTRETEERAYKKNLWRIFIVVGAIFAAAVVFLLLRGK